MAAKWINSEKGTAKNGAGNPQCQNHPGEGMRMRSSGKWQALKTAEIPQPPCFENKKQKHL